MMTGHTRDENNLYDEEDGRCIKSSSFTHRSGLQTEESHRPGHTVEQDSGASARMRRINPDGSISEMRGASTSHISSKKDDTPSSSSKEDLNSTFETMTTTSAPEEDPPIVSSREHLGQTSSTHKANDVGYISQGASSFQGEPVRTTKSTWRLALLIFVVALVAGIGSILVVVMGKEEIESASTLAPSPRPMLMPSSSPVTLPTSPSPPTSPPASTSAILEPSSAPSPLPSRSSFAVVSPTKDRFEEVLERIGGIIFNDPMGLLDSSSRQYWALRWIADQDEAKLDVATTPSHILVERYVMTLFFNETGGQSSWRHQYDFLSESSACDWSRSALSCRSSEYISSLDLRDNGLEGTLPTEIGLLTNLVLFFLNGNSLEGTIPTEIGIMTGLTELDLSINQITGVIPTEIGLLTDLEFFDLGSNSVQGTIPTEIGLLTNLISLDLGSNDFSGQIPTELGLLTNLVYFLVDQDL